MGKLPEEKLVKTRKIRILLALAIPVVFLFLFNIFFFIYLRSYNPNLYYYIVQKKLSILKRIDTSPDWLVLGDSSGNQGIKTSMISDSLGGTSYNLCTFADMTLIDDCWMLDYLIKKNRAPKNVIISRVYDTWSRSINSKLYSQYPSEWVLANQNDPFVPLPDRFRKQVILDHLFPIIHHKNQIIELIKNPSNFFDEAIYLEENGFQPCTETSREELIKRDAGGHLDYVNKYKPKIGHYNLAALRYLQEVSEKNGINIYMFNSPIYDSLYYDKSFFNFYEELTDSIATYTKEFPNFHYLNYPPKPFPARLLQNVDHVVDEGADLFTGLIIKQIKESK